MEIVKDKTVEYRFISNYYDEPLHGTCYYQGVLYEFKRIDDEDNFDHWLKLFELNLFTRVYWKLKQKFFEICVGYHWSWYPKNHRTQGFHIRNPKWLYKFLFKLYYLF